MAIDLTTLDIRIRKLQKLRALLADNETRELMADPEVMDYLKQVVSNGNGNSNAEHANAQPQLQLKPDADETLPAEGSLKRKVLDTARTISGKFDTALIVQEMSRDGFRFEAQQPKISVNQALTKLAGKGLIRLVRRGSGRQPNYYEAVRTEVTQ
jgi:hypothetical protein